MEEWARFKAREQVLIVDGVPFKGRIGVKTVTDPVVPIEQWILGPIPEGVTATTTYTLIPDEGEEYPVVLDTMNATTGLEGTRIEITTK